MFIAPYRTEKTMKKLFLILTMACMLSGCITTAINAAAAIDQARWKRESEEGIASYMKTTREMIAKEDPMGYYYLGLAHAYGFQGLDNDAREVRRRYETAIQKGSNDANVALGWMLLFQNSSPWGDGKNSLPRAERDPDKGMALLKSAAAKECFYTHPGAGAPTTKESIHSKIGYLYRDGRGVAKDPEEAKFWLEKRDACEAERKKICSVNDIHVQLTDLCHKY
jgi:TPR repeat protein